jgi:hypothetical protein
MIFINSSDFTINNEIISFLTAGKQQIAGIR